MSKNRIWFRIKAINLSNRPKEGSHLLLKFSIVIPYFPSYRFKRPIYLFNLFIYSNRPKEGNHTFLDDYREAEAIGKKEGDCMTAYPQCPVSIFNFIPDVYTKDDQVAGNTFFGVVQAKHKR